MPADLIVGTQWGDEGKGKIVDIFSESYDVIVRYQGGANAGHTVIVGDEKYILHLLPSGILHSGKMNIIGSGVVIDIEGLVDEMDELISRGVKIGENSLRISENAHLVMPYHKAIDAGRENKMGKKKIGTTARGIGPAYTDKYSRSGIRVRDMFEDNLLKEKIRNNLDEKNFMLKNYYRTEEIDVEKVFLGIKGKRERVRPYITDTSYEVNTLLDKGKKILFEGAQGALLDIDFGTYPYVTSSNPTVGGALSGIGMSSRKIGRVIGITKAYQTRVGRGPFPTEMDNKIQDKTREAGGEYGATTGRPRSCGWLDLVALKYAARINGLTEIILTKADVLSVLATIKAAVKYKVDGAETDRFIPDGDTLMRVEPVYKEFPGWKKDISGVRDYKDLPGEVKEYMGFIEEFTGVKVSRLSVGPDRKQILSVG